MLVLAIVVSAFVYFVLGGLWFGPIFGRQWAEGLGFQPPADWKPPMSYYLVPFIGSLFVAMTIAILHMWIKPVSMVEAIQIGLVVGIGIGISITAVNATAPNMAKPTLYSIVTGLYHCLGIVICSVISFSIYKV